MAAKLEGGAYLSSFVDAISKKLSSLLEGDSFLLGNFDVELLENLEKCLNYVRPVLLDAEQKQFREDRVKRWLVDLQDALYMADDLVDELSTKAATATPRDPGNSYDWSGPVDSIIYDDGVNVIQKIVGTLKSVVERKGNLPLEESAKFDTSRGIETTSLVVSSDVLGREEDKEKIINMLLDNTNDVESRVTVISIVGMGGIGKTTLAQFVYNDAKLVGKFDIKAWVCVAENPDPIHVTRAIIGSIDSSPCNLDRFDSLQTNLNEKFKKKTFLIVLDDVWHYSSSDWEKFLQPFRNGNIGSKILLTTRNQNFASSFVANNLPYRLNLLSKEDCWSVFLMHSSISMKSPQYPALKPIAEKIVEKCKGLPLAVKTLGALLSNNYNEEAWENILKSEIWELSEEDDCEIVSALRVSYHYLPSHLKRCFVYCSLFPQDYQFDKDELILLWMAEDFLQPKKNVTLENIGCAYFDELLARSFFQPSSANEKLFVMHDLMHDVASFFGEKFYFKLKKFENRNDIDNKTRHLSYATEYEDNRKLYEEAYNNGAVHMRTFLDFFSGTADEVIFIGSDSWLFQQQFQCLRVLSFQCAASRYLPNSIELGELIHLRYLNLSNSLMVTLSESICKLHNLQTLKLAYCRELKMLPNRMKDLVNLRHLDIRGCDGLEKMPNEMSKLKHLNFLSDYIIGDDEENGIRELEKLDNLHGSFWISNLEKVKNSDEASEAKMGNKKHIDSFKLKWLPKRDIDDVQRERDILDKLQPHEKLKELSIEGYRGETFPDWLGLSAYSNMTKLTLKRCWYCHELPSPGQLPSLQHLEFENMLRWQEWHFPQEFDGFPQLRILSIKNCPKLRGALPAHLPALEELTIVGCENLTCPLPRAPKLHQLLVKDSSRRHTNVKTHTAIISDSHLVNSVLKSLPHVQTSRFQGLEIRKCSELDSISADYLPASLQDLEIFDCSSLRLSEQLQHKSLKWIYLYDCRSLKLFSLGDLPNLKGLAFGKCPRLENVVVPQALPSLRSLSFSSCNVLASLPALGIAAPNLEKLDLYDCKEIDCFAEECLPPSLNILEVQRCMKLARWIASNGLQSEGLTHLKLGDCFDVKSFPREGLLPASLESLDFWYFPDLETLDCKGLHHLTSLKELSITDCLNLENITDANSLASIANICIGKRCPLRTKLEEMEDPRIQFVTVADKYIYSRV